MVAGEHGEGGGAADAASEAPQRARDREAQVPAADVRRPEAAEQLPGTAARERQATSELRSATNAAELGAGNPYAEASAHSQLAKISDRRGVLRDALRQPEGSAADRQAAAAHLERAVAISESMGDRGLELQGIYHGNLALQRAKVGDWASAEAHLRDGYAALQTAGDRQQDGMDPRLARDNQWSKGQRVADQAVDANNPEVAVEVMDRLSTDLGPPPATLRPSHELARFAATLQSGEALSPRETLESARTIGKQFRDQRQFQAAAMPHILAASHLLAEGQTVEAGLALVAARRYVSYKNYPTDAHGAVSDVQSWLEHAASPTERTQREMRTTLRRLDAAGAAPQARQLATSLEGVSYPRRRSRWTLRGNSGSTASTGKTFPTPR
jgi:hypothetical protein